MDHLYLKLNDTEHNNKIITEISDQRIKDGYNTTENNIVIYYTN